MDSWKEIARLKQVILDIHNLHTKDQKYLDATPVCDYCREDFPCTTLKLINGVLKWTS